jgi:hypothetical protein
MVQVFEQAPDRALRPFIQRFLVVEFPSFHCDAHLPDTSPVAATISAGLPAARQTHSSAELGRNKTPNSSNRRGIPAIR